MERLIELSERKKAEVPSKFRRYLFNTVTLKGRLTGISGARGSGKTTLMLQLMAEHFPKKGEAMYISLDDLYFSGSRLLNLAEDFERKGGKCLFVDEVHKYEGWSQELKIIYDNLNRLKVVFSSSSALQIYKGSHDLSRRALMYRLQGLSFREFLEFKHGQSFSKLTLEQIVSGAENITKDIYSEIRPYKFFDEYLNIGYYPFFIEDEITYHERLHATINLLIETDLPAVESIDYRSSLKLKKLLFLLSEMVPFKPNIAKLAMQLDVTRPTLMRYLEMLHRAQILMLLGKETRGVSALNKPEKIYLHNTNLFHALNYLNPNTGSMRETFFLNQVSHLYNVHYSDKTDFLVNSKYYFEIGGKNKSSKQIRDLKNAFIVKDDIEYGTGNIIPLYLFGFLY